MTQPFLLPWVSVLILIRSITSRPRRAGWGAVGVIVVRGLAGLVLVGCALSAPQQGQLADFEGCADKRHVAYEEMRRRVVTVMVQQRLDLAEILTGLEVVEEVRSSRNVRLSNADADFINRNRFLDHGGTGAVGRTWFEALRSCLEERHGYKIRRIEIR